MKTSLLGRLSRKEKVHFLHIGKTAGSQIKKILNQNGGSKFKFTIHSHKVKLRDIPASERYFFSIREPISRFKSAFYYRKNKGLPGVYQDWSAFEKQAFDWFPTANSLAEALFEDDIAGEKAFQAMQSIAHVASHQVDWFERCGILETQPPISIIRQEHFLNDMRFFLQKLFSGTEFHFEVTTDENLVRKNKYPIDASLSSRAISNLEKWYCRDLIFYTQCTQWIERNNSHS